MKKQSVAIENLGKRRERILAMGMFGMLAVTVIALASFGPLLAFADAVDMATEIIFKILKVISIVIGAFFILFGIVKIAIAQANDTPQESHKSIMMVAAGLVLILLGTVILNDAMVKTVSDMIREAAN